MFFIPYDSFILNTKLGIKEASKLLLDNVEQKEINYMSISMQKEEKFVGEVGESDFKIAHTARFKNSFYPLINGKLYQNGQDTDISIKMHPSLPMVIFTVVATIIALIILNFSMQINAIFIVVVYLNILLMYKHLAKKSKNKLSTLFIDKGSI